MGVWNLYRSPEEIRADMAERAELAQALEPVRRLAGYWAEHFSDDPAVFSGWLHHYVCPKCAAQLSFDVARPGWHECPACGAAGEGRDVEEAWTYQRRVQIGAGIEAAALLFYIENDERMRAYALSAIAWYADRYVAFPELKNFPGRAKVMAQSLDEAVWGTKLLRALHLLGLDPACEQMKRLHHLLTLPMARLVMAQQHGIHNIPLWHSAFAVGAGAVMGDRTLLRQSLEGDLGARSQVTRGFTSDGIWYENSTLYHYYALEAATNLCEMLRLAERPDYSAVYERVVQGYLAPTRIMFADGSIPATNDGWNGGSAVANVDRLRRAYRALEGAVDASSIAQALWTLPEKVAQPSLGALLMGTPADPGRPGRPVSVLLPESRMAMLRGKACVFCKFGNLTASHAHPDALSICIEGFALDTGTPGYGSALHREWYTQTISHATFVVDGQNQSRTAKGTADMAADGCGLRAEVTDAYPGVRAQRTLQLTPEFLSDELSVACDGPRIIDWVFHASGDFCADGDAAPCAALGEGNGYQHIRSWARWSGDEPRFSWTAHGQTLALRFPAALGKAADIYLITSPDNPGHLMRNGVVVRVLASEAAYCAQWSLKPAQ